MKGRFRERFQASFYPESAPDRIEMKRARTMSIFEGVTARTIGMMTGGAFIAGLARLYGADDATAGLIGAVPVLAGLVAALSSIVFERLPHRKLLIVLCAFAGRLMLAAPIVIPYLTRNPAARIGTLLLLYLAGNLLQFFMLPSAVAWISDIAPLPIRARYFARREGVVIGLGTLVSLSMGVVLDVFKNRGDSITGFTVLFGVVFVLALVNFATFSRMREIPHPRQTDPPRLRDPFVLPFKDPRYRRLLLVITAWSLGYQVGIPFTSVYLISGLGLDYTVAALYTAGMAAVSVLSARLWAKVADRTSWMALFFWLVLLQAVSCVFWVFTNPSTAPLMLPLSAIATGAMVSGMNMSMLGLMYGYAPERNRTVYMGTLYAVNGVAGFAGALLGATALGILGMHGTFALSAVLLVFAAALSAFLFRRRTEADSRTVLE